MFSEVKGAKTVSALELPSLQRDGDAVIIDVNTKNDFNIAHIPDALNFPLESLNNNNKALLKLKDQTAIITCQTGSISNKAAKNLIELGFSNIHILRGGLIGWTKENLPVTSKT